MSIEQFRAMTKQEFLGQPTIIKATAGLHGAYAPKLFDDLPLELFLPGLKAKYSPHGVVVYKGSTLVAHLTYLSGESTYVDPSVRGKGIGEEMLYQFCMRGLRTIKNQTPHSKVTESYQRIREKVWDRIQSEMAKPAAPAKKAAARKKK